MISRGYKHDPGFMKLVDSTNKVDDIDVNGFDALVAAGQQNFSGGETAQLIVETLGR